MFGGETSSGDNSVRRTIIFGTSIGVAFILLLVAGIVTDNWLGMIMILPLIMVPISMIVVEALGGGSGGSGEQIPGNVNTFHTTWFLFAQDLAQQLRWPTSDSASLGSCCLVFSDFLVSL
jgi:hypothetical protein